MDYNKYFEAMPNCKVSLVVYPASPDLHVQYMHALGFSGAVVMLKTVALWQGVGVV
jgi:hypothetical protein